MAALDKDEICRVLGVAADADADAVKKAYRVLAMRYHPDRNPDDPAARERFDEVNRAYAAWSAAENGTAGAPATGTPLDPFDPTVFEDLFKDFFGGSPGVARGADLTQSLVLSQADVQVGCQRDVAVKRRIVCAACQGTGDPTGVVTPCVACGGSGQQVRQQGFFNIATPCATCRGRRSVPRSACGRCEDGTVPQVESLKVTVPAGVASGQSLRIPGKGDELPGCAPGDLYLTIEVAAASGIVRRGADAVLEVIVDARHVLFGGKMSVRTLDGQAMVAVPRGVRDGATVALPGLGYPKPAGATDPYRGEVPRGDQIVVFRVPPELTSLQRNVFIGTAVAAAAVALFLAFV